MAFWRPKQKKIQDLDFERAIGDVASYDQEVVEVPLGNRPLFYLGAAIFAVALVFVGRVFYLNVYDGQFYRVRAELNLMQYNKSPAPRGLIYARDGKALAENKAIFTAVLDIKELLRNQGSLESTLTAIEDTLYVSKSDMLELIKEAIAEDFSQPLILKEGLSQSELVRLKGLNLPTVLVQNDFERRYAEGPVFAPVVGYVGRVSESDLRNNPDLTGEDFVGKAGIELFYNDELSGEPGMTLSLKNARGKILNEEKKSEPKIGKSLKLTIDPQFQEYFYYRLASGLASLGRRVGIGLALDPKSGEVLALVNIPSFDNAILSGSGNNAEKAKIFNSQDKPLFNRVTSGFYNPGSTIKPLVGIAALKEGVIDPKREIFSPGYIDIPNPYDPENPTRYLDWRYQGNVNLASAIAQSSNVYFYTVGGGAATQILDKGETKNTGYVKGLGIEHLRDWWQKFNLGKKTGIDMPAEAEGFLPSVAWKQEKTKTAWLLGDTYNVSIGQGDLLLSPLQLLNYVAAIANGGKILEPILNLDREHPKVITDLSYLQREISEVQKGMRQVVTSPMGTAYLLHDLAFSVSAKTGTAQVQSGAQENAIFVGYAPSDNPRIAILILVENSREGSLNTVPIAKDVLGWYYWNRVKR